LYKSVQHIIQKLKLAGLHDHFNWLSIEAFFQPIKGN